MVVIAVDGPSGSGKSSVSKAVARHFGLAYLDTGAMYRAATLWALASGTDLSDQAAVTAAVRAMPLEVGLSPDQPQFRLGGHDVSEAIRESTISTQVSAVATNLDVRAELRRRQRDIIDKAERGGTGIVAEGRDITTVVAPDAQVRVLLTASPEARLRRRSLDVFGKADDGAVAATRDQVLRRDADDSTVMEFQTAAEGVITVDSSDLNFDETVDAVIDVAKDAAKGKRDHIDVAPAAMPLRGTWSPADEGGRPTGADIPTQDAIRTGSDSDGRTQGIDDEVAATSVEAAAWETAQEEADAAPRREVGIDTDHGRAYVAGISEGEAQRLRNAYDQR